MRIPSAYNQPLYIRDLNIDEQKAKYACRMGHLERVSKGVYLNARLSPEERRAVLLRNAARIATQTVGAGSGILAGSSAFHRGPVEGHLLLATPWGGRPIDVGGVFTIFQMRSPLDVGMNREVEYVEIEDDFGPYSVKRLADEMLILKNFEARRGRPRSTYLNHRDLVAVVDRCVRTTGGKEALIARLARLGDLHGLAAYSQEVRKFVEGVGGYDQVIRPLKSFKVYWHKTPMATLSHDGHIWSFDYEPGINLQLSVSERKGQRAAPTFLGSILPEVGPNADATLDEKLDSFQFGHRYISNITVHPVGQARPGELIVDVLAGELDKFMTNKLEFRGALDGFVSRTSQDDLLLQQMQENPDLPRLSGMQVKLAVHLDEKGVLSPAVGKAFTHILKVAAGNPDYHSLGSMEWYSLTVAKLCGLNVEKFALVDLGGRGPALLVERFDVRRDLNDQRMILTEDFWSVAGMRENAQKYRGELMDVADALLKHSTDPLADGKNLVSQAIFSWLTFNGDMHLKNLLLVKEAPSLGEGFASVRLSPAYDILCTQVYPNDAKTAAIALCGSRQHTLSGFRALGKKLGITADEVDAMVDYLSAAIPMFSQRVADNLPEAVRRHPLSMQHVSTAISLFQTRCMMMIAELDGARSRKGAKSGEEAADASEASFSAEDMGDSALDEHIQAERRRSWVPQAAVPATARPRPRP